MIYWILKYTVGILIRIIWVKKVSGLKNIPKNGPLIICANHSSYFDFLTLIAVCPRRIYFLTGEVFFKKWQWRWLVKSTNQIKVDRKSKDKIESVNKVIEYLGLGRVVGIFPEGTRSNDGNIGKFYNGAAMISKKANVPILPVGIIGAFQIMSRFDKYPRFKKCTINMGEKMLISNLDEVDLIEKVRNKMINLISNECFNN